MTPKEEAKELIEKYLKLEIEIGGQYDGYLTMKMHDAKACALVSVDAIIKALLNYDLNTEAYLKKDFPTYFSAEVQNMDSDLRYWMAVRNEIEAL